MHTEAFTQRSLYTEELLHTKAFTHTQRGFYTEKPLHKGAFCTQKVLQREVFTLRSFCTQTSRSLYTQKLLHKEVFTQIYSFHTQTRLHTEAFTQRSLYTLHREFLQTVKSLHRRFTQRSFHTQKLLHKEVFAQSGFYTETFTHKSFYTEKSLHRGTFTRSNKLKLAAVLREKPLAGAFGNSLAPQKSRLFPTKFLFHELFSKNIRNIFLKQVPIQSIQAHTAMKCRVEKSGGADEGRQPLNKYILKNRKHLQTYFEANGKHIN